MKSTDPKDRSSLLVFCLRHIPQQHDNDFEIQESENVG
jgi:hypothetical protein